MDEFGNSEAELLSLAQGGNLDAFEEIVKLHERRIFALALRLTGKSEDAQDAAQEVFVRLFRNLRQIDAGRSVGPWLYSVTVNVCRDLERVRQRSRLIPMGEKLTAFSDPAQTPEGLYADQQREQWLRSCLQELPEKERAALTLRELEGLSTQEVARALGSAEGTIRAQICSARIKLRKLMAERMGGKS